MSRPRLLALLFAGGVLSTSLVFFAPRSIAAQAIPIASKSNDMSVFAGYAYVHPDFVPTPISGETFGLNLTHYVGWRIAPSVEARVNIADGPVINERSYLFGVRAQTDFFGRFHPYADFLVGIGDIHYNYANNGYTGDNTTAYSYGGGVDIDLYKHFLAKVDFQGQHWDLGENLVFTPNILMVGVAYRIPFRKHEKQQDLVRP